MTVASLGGFLDAVGSFFGSLASIQLVPLLIGLGCFGIYLTIRSRAFFHALRAAYPTDPILWRRIWGSYVAAYGFNNVIPARGGDVIKLFLVRTSVPRSTYPGVAAAITVEATFDLTMAVPVLAFAFSQGVFPKPPDFADIGAFDLSFFAGNPQLTLFLLTALGVLVLVAIALLQQRVKAFWARVRQGFTILFDRRRWFREIWLVLFCGWLVRCTAFWFLLEAFNVGGSVRNVLLVLGVNAVAALMPFTPGGAGVQQALLVQVFGASAAVAAYSVGQQVSIAAFSLGLGFVALVFVFGFRSFKAVIEAGRAHRDAERAAATG
jgi:uncharacterized membrane protein YbhN (UPF0104 family)